MSICVAELSWECKARYCNIDVAKLSDQAADPADGSADFVSLRLLLICSGNVLDL